MKVAIHQPQYFPWPRYVHKVMAADVFVYLDMVQFSKNGVQNRNQIKTSNGALWLTVPVKHHLGQKLNEMEVADVNCTRKHFKTLQANYGRSAGFLKWREELQTMLDHDYESLVQLTQASTEFMLDRIATRATRVRASDLKNVGGEASKLVASICRELQATDYLTGTGALEYLNRTDFEAIGCRIQVQTWEPFTYPQAYPAQGFIQDLSTLDLLLNCPDEASDLISEAGGWEQLTQ